MRGGVRLIRLTAIRDETGYQTVRHIESVLCAANPAVWHFHQGGLGVDRYFFGGGAVDFFRYAYLVSESGRAIGYALLYEDERSFHLALLPSVPDGLAADALEAVEAAFSSDGPLSTEENDTETGLIGALLRRGYVQASESRFQAVCPLARYRRVSAPIDPFIPDLLKDRDIEDRIMFAALPTGSPVTKAMFQSYRRASDARYVRDEVVRDPHTGALAAYLSWWMDPESRTVMLNPVACLEPYRRRGILKNCVIRGLCAMRDQGYRYAYVDTGIGNKPAIGLYEAAGFIKSGRACRYDKN